MIRKIIRRCNRREVWLLLISVGLLMLILNPPQTFVSRHHAWKAKQFLEAAEKAKQADDWDLAKEKAKQGLRWAPGSSALRKIIVGAVAKEGRAIDSVLLAEQFFNPESSLEERAKLMEVALNGGDQVAFSRFYNHLPEEQRNNPEIVIQRMRLGLQLGRHQEVEQLFASLAESDRTAAANVIRLAATVQAAATTGNWGPAIDNIDEWLGNAVEDKAISWQVFRLLGEIPATELDAANLIRAGDWLRKNAEDATAEDELIGASIEMAAMGEQARSIFLEQTVDRFADSAPTELGRWLVRLGHPAKALQLPGLSEANASSDVGRFDARLDALVAAERWDDAIHWLDQPPPGSHSVMLWLSRAQIADKIDNRSLRRQSLIRAIEEAGVVSSENRFFAIYEVAIAVGENDLAARAAIDGVSVPSAIFPPSAYFLPVLRHLWEQGSLDEFRKLNLALLRNQPGDLDRSNDELYVSLLVDEQPKLDRMVEIGRRLIELQPANVSFRTTLAWVLLRSGEPVEAKIVLEEAIVDWDDAAAADKLVRAHVMLANDDADGAMRIVASIEAPSELSKVEIEKLLKPLQP